MNVVISVNEKYIDQAETMLLSLRNHCVGEIVVYLLNHSLRKEKVEKFAKFLHDKCDIRLVGIQIGQTIFDDFPLVFPKQFSIEIFYRIIAPYLLEEKVQRALWLDSDIIIKGNIDDFYNMDFGGRSLVVCKDTCEERPMEAIPCKEKLQIAQSHAYFNSGVMLMNIHQIREKYTLEEVCDICKLYRDKLYMPDQDILNVLFQNDVLYVAASEYNVSPLSSRKEFMENYENIKIIHYFSHPKPWQIFRGIDPVLDYWKIQRQRGRWFRYCFAALFRIMGIDRACRRCWCILKKPVKRIWNKWASVQR